MLKFFHLAPTAKESIIHKKVLVEARCKMLQVWSVRKHGKDMEVSLAIGKGVRWLVWSFSVKQVFKTEKTDQTSLTEPNWPNKKINRNGNWSK